MGGAIQQENGTGHREGARIMTGAERQAELEEIRDALALWRLHVAALEKWPGGIEMEVCQGPLGAVISISDPGSTEDEEYLVEAGGDSLARAVADATKELE